MKRLYFILIAIAFSLCIANPGCSDFAETDAVPPEGVEEGTVQSELLENGNELLTYPNGVRVERTPSGEILWQGDILLEDWQLNILTNPQTRGGILNNAWPNGVIYYEWDANIAPFTKQYALTAMETWADACGLVFVDVTGKSTPSNRIRIYNGDGNRSRIGMVGGRQDLSLSLIGATEKDAIHELGHALGLIHEHCRADRDEYITVYYDNIKPGERHNFDKVSGNSYKYSAEFDYSSVMIYDSYIRNTDFVYDTTKPVIQTKTGAEIESSLTPTALDIRTVNEMYKKKIHTVKVSSESSLSGTVTGGGDNYSYLSACTLRATPAQNRSFSGWFEDGQYLSLSNPYTFSVTGDRNIIAKFTTTNNNYSLETSVSIHPINTNGLFQFVAGGTVSPGSLNSTAYATLNLKATPAAGFTFSHWLDLDSEKVLSAENPYPVKMTRDMRIQAVFSKNGFVIVPKE